MARPGTYPAPRPRAGGAAPLVATKFERYESSNPSGVAGDTDAILIAFSGRPDSIYLRCGAQDAVFTLTDRLGRETHTIMMPAFSINETFISRDTVWVRNRTPGLIANVQAVGKWAAPAERV